VCEFVPHWYLRKDPLKYHHHNGTCLPTDSREIHQGDPYTMRHESDLHKKMTPLSSQNLKTLGLWVFFFYMLLNLFIFTQCGTKLTLDFLKSCKRHIHYI